MRLRPVVAAVALFSPWFLANASSITQTVTVGTNGNPTVTTDLNKVSFSNMLNQFNAAAISAANGGATVTLNGVTLKAGLSTQTGGTLINTAAQAQDFDFDQTLTGFITGAGNGTATDAQQIAVSAFGKNGTAVGALNNDYGTVTYSNVGSGSAVNYPFAGDALPGTLDASSSIFLSDPASLAAFVGSGSFGLALNTITTDTFHGGGGNILASLNTMAGGSFSVQYDYDLSPPETAATPEPSSLVLLGTGMVGAAGALRRRLAR